LGSAIVELVKNVETHQIVIFAFQTVKKGLR